MKWFYENSGRSKLRIAGRGTWLYFAGVIIIGILIFILKQFYSAFDIDDFHNAQANQVKQYIETNGLFTAALYVTFIGPFIEELGFRLGLTLNKKLFCISSFFFLFILLSLFTESYMSGFIYKAIICLTCSVLLFRYTPSSFWESLRHHKSKLIIISTVIFAVLHSTYFSEFDLIFLPYYILIISRLFWAGLVIAYVRVNINFMAGLLFHMAINTLVFLQI